MKKLAMSIVLSLIILQQTLNACGTLDHWIDAYYNRGWLKDKTKKEALIGIYECGRYHYHGQDNKLLDVMLDVIFNYNKIYPLSKLGPVEIEKNLDRLPASLDQLLENIYRRYECLIRASDIKGYEQLVKMFGNQSCTTENLKQMKVNVKTTAHIRQSPNGIKIGYLKNGSVVNKIGQNGEWIKINIPGRVNDSKRIDVGFIHASLVEDIK